MSYQGIYHMTLDECKQTLADCVCVVGKEAVQVLKLVLILFSTFRNFLRSDSNFKPLFTVNSQHLS